MAKYADENITCIVTGRPGAEYHHIKSQGAGGTDEDFNMIPICHKIHEQWHKKGTLYMAENYSYIREWLLENNWYLCVIRNKWVHD
jgi:hypothetical protein